MPTPDRQPPCRVVTISPLPLHVLEPVDEPIILPITDGTVDATVAHLPALRRELAHGNIVLRWDGFEDPPARWVAACGVQGWVYNRGGCLAGLPVCGDCEAAV
jgi:hypothetical protein